MFASESMKRGEGSGDGYIAQKRRIERVLYRGYCNAAVATNLR